MMLRISQGGYTTSVPLNNITILTGEQSVVKDILGDSHTDMIGFRMEEPTGGVPVMRFEADSLLMLIDCEKDLKKRKHNHSESVIIFVRDGYSMRPPIYKVKVAQKILELTNNYDVYFVVESYDYEFIAMLGMGVEIFNAPRRNETMGLGMIQVDKGKHFEYLMADDIFEFLKPHAEQIGKAFCRDCHPAFVDDNGLYTMREIWYYLPRSSEPIPFLHSSVQVNVK